MDKTVFWAPLQYVVRQYRRINNVQRNEVLFRYVFIGSLFPSLADQELSEGMKKERTKPTLGRISSLDKMAVEHNFMKETLSQILGFLVRMAFAPEVTIDRLPVVLDQ